MKTLGMIAALLVLPALASADIAVNPQDVSVLQDVGTFTVVIPVALDAATTLGGYDINLDITPQAPAPAGGLTFKFTPNGQAAMNQLGGGTPAGGYLFQGGSSGQLVALNSTNLAISVDDQSVDVFFGETVPAGSYDLVEVNFVVSPATIWTDTGAGDLIYDVDISKIGFYDEYGEDVSDPAVSIGIDVSAQGFQVTITPEPATLGLLGIGAIGLLLRRKRSA